MAPHDFWQELLPPHSVAPDSALKHAYPATLADGRQLLLPIRPLSDGKTALASLIINQASFAVSTALADDLAERLYAIQADVIVGLPTLGLTLASAVAHALGHSRYVPLGNSRKFWYDDALSVPTSSITTPDQNKRLFIDPRMLPLLKRKRVVLIDDVVSSGSSIIAGLSLLEKCGIVPVAIGAAMLQSERYINNVTAFNSALITKTYACFSTPALKRCPDGYWHASK